MPPLPNAIVIHPPGHTYDHLATSPAVQVPPGAYALYSGEDAAKALNAALCAILDAPNAHYCGELVRNHKPVLGAYRDLLSACILGQRPVGGEV